MVRRQVTSAVTVLAVLLGLVVVVAAPATAGDRAGARERSAFATPELRARVLRRPVSKEHGFADPSVVRYRGGYVGVATGSLAPRSRAQGPGGPWRRAGSALLRTPSWASGNDLWAADLVRVGDRWVLYFAAPVEGLGRGGRCIGVATARRPTGRFVSRSPRPLVCPAAASTPRAGDPVPGGDRRVDRRARRGVIDAEAFRRGRQRFLLYRTQGTPSSIRLVGLTRDGRSTRARSVSRELVRADGIIENPVLLTHGRGYYLLTSAGYYGDCGYRTTWRRTTRLWDWSRSRSRVLMDSASTGLCGPGGADVVDTRVVRSGRAARALVFLHAWSCPRLGGVCPTGPDYQRTGRAAARRSLYAAWLWWADGRPRVTSFVLPTRERPEPPAPSTVPTAPEVPLPPVVPAYPSGFIGPRR